MQNNQTISEILSAAIAPVTLITGVAFLTSIMAPRFGRCIDRIRNILSQLQELPDRSPEKNNHLMQLQILYSRTRILRNTMISAGICILFVVLTIATTFSHLVFHVPGRNMVLTEFVFALVSLVVLTVGFIYDFLSSLTAVKLEILQGVGSKGVDLEVHFAPKDPVKPYEVRTGL